MGARGSGRKASPVALLAAGRRGARAVVDVPGLKLRPPAGTPAPVAAIFRRLVRELGDAGILHALDVYLLAQLATALHINAEAAAQLAREGATYSDPMHAGRRAKNPAWQIWRESAATARALSALFGLSPVDRQRMVGTDSGGADLVDVLRVLADE